MKKYTFKIDTIHCGNCSKKIDDAISSNLRVKSVKSSHESRETIVLCKDNVDLIEIKKLIVGLGHRITDTIVEDIEEDKKGLFSFIKKNK